MIQLKSLDLISKGKSESLEVFEQGSMMERAVFRGII